MFSLLLFGAGLAALWWRPGRRTPLWAGLGLVIYLLLWTTHLAMRHFTGTGLTEAVVYTLLHDVGGAGIAGYWGLVLSCTAAVLVAPLAGWWLQRRLRARPRRTSYWLRLAWLPVLAAGVLHPLTQDAYGLVRFYHAEARDPEGFHAHYRPYVRASAQDAVRNVLFVYAESLERNYFDEALFPGLMPNLKALRAEAREFTDIDQVPGAEFTIGGMVASQCGTPLFAEHHPNSSAPLTQFMPGATCLGSVLKDHGYQLSFVQGAPLSFAGKGNFYRTHGFDHVYGKENMAELDASDAPVNAWGHYDDFVLDRVWDRYQALSQSGERFGLFALTLDTHHYDGFVSPRCKAQGIRYRHGRNPMLNAVACSDWLLAELVRKVRASPGGRNTVIVLASDHLAMNNPVYERLSTVPRKHLFWIWEPEVDGEQLDTPGTVLDMGVTVLNRMGVNAHFGLGRDLLAEPSLRVGRTSLDADLNGWRASVLKFWGVHRLGPQAHVNLEQGTVSFGRLTLRYPVLLHVDARGVFSPRFEEDVAVEYGLVDQLPAFADGDRFVWVDQCGALSWVGGLQATADVCVALGRMGGVVRVDELYASGAYPIHWPPDTTFSAQTALEQRERLAARRYVPAEPGLFDLRLAGVPDFLVSVEGLTPWERHGRWTDALVGPRMALHFVEPLPTDFELEISAAAYGPNIGQPVRIRAGNVEALATFDAQLNRVAVRLRGAEGARLLTIEPPQPRRPVDDGVNEDTRQLGLLVQTVRVIPR